MDNQENSLACAELEAMELIKELVSLRESLMLSQRQASTLLGWSSHGGLSSIENGRTKPSLARVIQILHIYGYHLEIVKNKELPG